MTPLIDPDESHAAWQQRIDREAAQHALAETTPTQVAHPWRATLRTILQALVAALVVLPLAVPVITDWIAENPGLLPTEVAAGVTAAGAAVVAIAGLVARLMAVPGVDEFLRTYIPVFASKPKE